MSIETIVEVGIDVVIIAVLIPFSTTITWINLDGLWNDIVTSNNEQREVWSCGNALVFDVLLQYLAVIHPQVFAQFMFVVSHIEEIPINAHLLISGDEVH